ncbi:uncharacterized protein OCT59_030188 [Rhizophagus irregularis]|uniref:uncharacterized protein n=1 Tax=Rhizophagus irregularis TaxID=588596 RepID=UPI0033329074|nr:hypothetical protein OCT59_030188 [Rhizophagus irregularis]
MANRNLPEPIKFITDVFVGALNILKPIFSIIIALYFAWYSFTFLSNNFQQELSMQCWAIGQLDVLDICPKPVQNLSKTKTFFSLDSSIIKLLQKSLNVNF